MSYLKLASSSLLTCNLSSKNKKTLNLGSKVPYFGIFGLQFNKGYYQIFDQHPCETINFNLKQKKNKLGTKKVQFGSLRWNVVIFVSSAPKFLKLQSFVQKL